MPFADVEDTLGRSGPGRQVAAVGDQLPRGSAGRVQISRPRDRGDDGRDGERSQRGETPRCAGRADPSSRVRCAQCQGQDARPTAGDRPISTRWACLRAEPGDQQQAEAERADDGADRVGGIDAADQPPGVLTAGRGGGQGQREARAPQDARRAGRPRGSGPDRAGSVNQGLRGQRRVDRPVGQRLGQHVGRPGDARRPAAAGSSPGPAAAAALAARQQRPDAAADAQAHQEHGQDDRERVDRRAEQQREQARPDDLGARGRSGRRGRWRRRPARRRRPGGMRLRLRRRAGLRLRRCGRLGQQQGDQAATATLIAAAT